MDRWQIDRIDVLAYILQLLADITADWDIGETGEDTRLDALGLQSISLVYLIAEIQERYGLGDALFRKLRQSRMKVTDLRVGQVADFVCAFSASARRSAVPSTGRR